MVDVGRFSWRRFLHCHDVDWFRHPHIETDRISSALHAFKVKQIGFDWNATPLVIADYPFFRGFFLLGVKGVSLLPVSGRG
jgi:hypothetical protein